MPIINRLDAAEVEQYVARFFHEPPSGRALALRRLFVEELDFAGATGAVSLANAPKNVTLPPSAERIASMEGLHVVHVPLSGNGPDRVRKAEASAAAKLIADALHGDLLLAMTNPSCRQLHVIYPTFVGAAPSLRRMIIERDLRRRTAVQQLSNIFWHWKDTGSIRMAVDKAFDVEAVTKQFFEDYKRVFDNVMDAVVEGFGPSEAEAKKLFVQTLFNRLMFIYFLSRKSWLKFNGDPDYLNALRKDYSQSKQPNFYANRLEVLFFTGLNNPDARDLHRGVATLIGDVPFLNGGLFDRTAEDKRPNILIPDAAIDQILQQLFDRYNFTVMESTPFDTEVAIDPEMLGKVFEELVTGRHESGSYYTPRPVVSFMCREALKGYLQGAIPSLPPEAIGQFVDQRDVSGLNLTTAGMVRRALEQIKVVDPACGSGAYLLGILHELVDLETVLYNEKLVVDPKSLYELKLRIIEENVYGADIDQFAVNVAMLRLWLSLSIEYDGYPPPALPNLDFKIVRGDSLTAPDPNPSVHGAQYQMFREQVHTASGRLAKLKHQHMNAVDPQKRMRADDIKKELANLRAALAFAPAPKDAVDWRVTFAEVFDQKGGFDIVIANPPYRRQEGLGAEKVQLERLYPQVYASTADYHVYFYNRSVQLLRDGGVLSFITSNKYMRAGYGEKIRGFLPSALRLSQVIDFGDLPVFTAAAYPAIVVGQKQPPAEGHTMRVADLAAPIRRYVTAQGKPVNRETVTAAMERLPAFLAESAVPAYPQVLLRKSGWILEDPALVRLFDRLMSQGTSLGKSVNGRMYAGIKTGLNDAFVIDEAKRQELIKADPRSAEVIKPWLRGRDIKRWQAEWSGLYVIFTRRGVNIRDYPAILAHLEKYRHPAVDGAGKKLKGLEPRGGKDYRKPGSYEWYEIQDNIAYYKEFEQPKVVWKKTSFRPAFFEDSSGAYISNTTHFIPGANPWLVAAMNSTIMEFFMVLRINLLRGGYIELTPTRIDTLPIPNFSENQKSVLTKLAEGAHYGTTEIEEKIDALVGQAFALRPDEIEAIQKYLANRWSLGPTEETDEDVDNE